MPMRDPHLARPPHHRSPDEAVHEVPTDRRRRPSRPRRPASAPPPAYRIEHDPRLPSQKKAPRGRRRPDPLADVWDSEIVPMLKAAPGLRPIAVFEEMPRRHPELGAGIRRTLERRIRAWRALHGAGAGGDLPAGARARPAGPVGLHRHGRARRHHRRRSRSTIGSTTSAWPSRASSMPMSCSAARASWRWPRGCRTRCGRSAACPREHRSDSLSAAFRNLDATPQEDLTRRYEALCAHYGMTPTRNNPRRRARERLDREPARPSQEGARGRAAAARHRATSTISPPIAASSTRSSAARNARNRKRIELERPALQPLPERRTADYEETIVTRHLERRLHAAQGVLHRAVAADRPSPAGAALRRPARTASSARRR